MSEAKSVLVKQARCYIELNAAAFAHNLRCVRELAPKAKLMAVVKADGYGHGMELTARSLKEADEFAVTTIDDAERLLGAGVNKPITLLSGAYEVGHFAWMRANKIRPVVFDYEQLNIFKQATGQEPIDVWLKLDTGMGRLGFSADELSTAYKSLSALSSVREIALMTHLANADQPERRENAAQFDLFNQVKIEADQAGQHYSEFSVLNSAGVVAFAEHAMDRVRPGLMLYGISPQHGKSANQLGLMPVMSLKSSVISVRTLSSGTSIGYGGTYTLDTDSRIAYVGCGYGDGYPRHATTGTTVLINDFLVPLVGRVSMDMIAVDVGELPVQVGDSATLWGEGNPIEDVAAEAGTIPYELTCSVTARVERIVING